MPTGPPSGPQPEHINLATSTLRFGALSWGEPGRPLALCLHGYPDTAWTWRHLGPQLAADGWRVIAPFMRGYAPSDLPADGCYEIGALVRDVVAIHAAAGGDRAGVVIGHDWGATAAYGAAAVAPERFAGVVALSVPPVACLHALLGSLPSPAALRLSVRQLGHSWYMLFQQLPQVSERALDRLVPRLWEAWSPGYDARHDVALVRQSLSDPARRTAALSYYRHLARGLVRPPRYPREQRAWTSLPSQPFLYVHGRNDGCMRVELVERCAELLSGARVELVPAAGHFAHLEHPAKIGALVGKFVSGLHS